MNVSRFQLSLNHEDVDVVKTGLDEFQNQVRKELHDLGPPDSYGYCGRQIFDPDYGSVDAIDALHNSFGTFLNPSIPALPPGCLLFKYLQASPQIDDLFVIWSLPDRDAV